MGRGNTRHGLFCGIFSSSISSYSFSSPVSVTRSLTSLSLGLVKLILQHSDGVSLNVRVSLSYSSCMTILTLSLCHWLKPPNPCNIGTLSVLATSLRIPVVHMKDPASAEPRLPYNFPICHALYSFLHDFHWVREGIEKIRDHISPHVDFLFLFLFFVRLRSSLCLNLLLFLFLFLFII